ncbi:hypothetical protein ACHAXS_004856 [Conticribra weissflogii]
MANGDVNVHDNDDDNNNNNNDNNSNNNNNNNNNGKSITTHHALRYCFLIVPLRLPIVLLLSNERNNNSSRVRKTHVTQRTRRDSLDLSQTVTRLICRRELSSTLQMNGS